jgi:hypothetical protein
LPRLAGERGTVGSETFYAEAVTSDVAFFAAPKGNQLYTCVYEQYRAQ